MASISSLGIGSGLDLNGLLDQMESAERQQLAPITQQQKSYQAKISAYGTLEGKLDDFREAAAKLADSQQFDAVKSNVSGDALTAVVGEDALPGTHDIVVNNKARAYSIATQGVTDKTEKLGAGAISFTLGNGDNFSIDVRPHWSTTAAVSRTGWCCPPPTPAPTRRSPASTSVPAVSATPSPWMPAPRSPPSMRP